jgi:hypothetical protein
VSFEPCSAATPAFSGGVVGPITGWAGSIIVTGLGCIRLRLRLTTNDAPTFASRWGTAADNREIALRPLSPTLTNTGSFFVIVA